MRRDYAESLRAAQRQTHYIQRLFGRVTESKSFGARHSGERQFCRCISPLKVEVRPTDDVSREVSEVMASSGDSKSAAQCLANFAEFSARLEQRASSIDIPSEALRRKNTYGDDGR
jgi:hypothetical protein